MKTNIYVESFLCADRYIPQERAYPITLDVHIGHGFIQYNA